MLYSFELKSNIKKIVFHIIIVGLLILISLENLKNSNSDIVIDALPKFISGLLGLDNKVNDNLSCIVFCSRYVLLLYLIYVCSLSLKVTCVSTTQKSDFIYTTISRNKILFKKALAIITIIFILSIVYYTAIYLVFLFRGVNLFSSIFILLINMLITLLLFMSVAIFIGSLQVSMKVSSIITTAIIFITYMLYSFSISFKLEGLSYIFVLKYALEDNINYFYLLFSITFSVLLIFFGRRNFKNKNL